jgi:hypothetical protein
MFPVVAGVGVNILKHRNAKGSTAKLGTLEVTWSWNWGSGSFHHGNVSLSITSHVHGRVLYCNLYVQYCRYCTVLEFNDTTWTLPYRLCRPKISNDTYAASHLKYSRYSHEHCLYHLLYLPISFSVLNHVTSGALHHHCIAGASQGSPVPRIKVLYRTVPERHRPVKIRASSFRTRSAVPGGLIGTLLCRCRWAVCSR